jgi:hypothetical protein
VSGHGDRGTGQLDWAGDRLSSFAQEVASAVGREVFPQQTVHELDELAEPRHADGRRLRLDACRGWPRGRIADPEGSTRPPDRWSTATAALAASTGERKKRLVTSVPMRIVDVYKAIAASVVGPSKSVVL